MAKKKYHITISNTGKYVIKLFDEYKKMMLEKKAKKRYHFLLNNRLPLIINKKAKKGIIFARIGYKVILSGHQPKQLLKKIVKKAKKKESKIVD